MILLCGIPSETPLAMVADELNQLGAPYLIFNQRNFANMGFSFKICDGEVTGWWEVDGQGYPLESFAGVFTRLMDDQALPELKDEPPQSPRRLYSRALHEALMCWYEIAPARVVNRTGPMGSNSSKPYQAQLIREHGLAIPETLITNEPELVREFLSRHPKVVYKSISGIRSIVKTFEPDDLARLESIRWCPIQFQEYIRGDDLRVHVVDSQVFATLIRSAATDYRYAHQQGQESELQAIELPDDLSEKCLRLSQALGLAFAGIDLKITADQRVYCFEVNPSPAFSYYESHTGQPIAHAVARYLAGLN